MDETSGITERVSKEVRELKNGIAGVTPVIGQNTTVPFIDKLLYHCSVSIGAIEHKRMWGTVIICTGIHCKEMTLVEAWWVFSPSGKIIREFRNNFAII